MRLRHNNVASTPQTETAAFKKWFGKSKVVDADGKPLVVYHGTARGGFSVFNLVYNDRPGAVFFSNKRTVAGDYAGYGQKVDLPGPVPRNLPTFKTVTDLRRFVKSPENDFDGWKMHFLESHQAIEEGDEATYTGMDARVVTRYVLWWQKGDRDVDIAEGYYPPINDLVLEANAAVKRRVDIAGVYAVYLRMLKPMVVDGKGAPWMSIPYKGGYYKTDQLADIARSKGHDGLILRNIYDNPIQQIEISDVYVVFDPHNIKSATANVGTFDRKNADIRMNPRARRKNPHHPHPQTETPEFKAWFGNSKMLDEHGEPERLYHLTASEFSVFKPGGHDPRLSGRVIYLTPYPHNIPAGHNTSGSIGDARVPGETWGYRQGTNVMPVYASIQRPLYIFDADDAQYAERFKFDSFAFPRTVSDKSLAALKEAGYDGIVYAGWRDAERFDLRTGRNVEIIAFEPTQIKSAIGNRGTFDPTDPDIRHNPDAPARVRLRGRGPSPKVEALLRDFTEASFPNPLGAPLRNERVLKGIDALVRLEPDGSKVFVAELRALRHRQGIGTQAMQFLTDLADKHGVKLALFPHPFGVEKMPLPTLVNFYRRFGFQHEDESGDAEDEMVRWPREKNPPRRRNGIARALLATTPTPAVAAFMAEWNERDMDTVLADMGVRVDVLVYGGDEIELELIESRVHKQGAGSRALRILLDLVDKHHLGVTLNAMPFSSDARRPPSLDDLVRFYQRFGFRVEEEVNEDEEPESYAMYRSRR